MLPPLEPGRPAGLALGVLVACAVLSPWPFGAVTPSALSVLTTAALGGACVALALGARRGGLVLPAVALSPLGAFVALVLLQLLPLPRPLHALLAPGSAAIWHPADPRVQAVLGAGPRPVSLDPDTTLRALALVTGLCVLAVISAPALGRARAARRALFSLALGGFVLCAYAIIARARFGPLLYGTFAVPTVSPFGPFVNKNHFAGWASMAALLVLGFATGLADDARGKERDWTATRRAVPIVLALVAALAMSLGVLAALSRGATLALVAGAVALGLQRLQRRRASGRLVVPSLLLALALGAAVVALAPREAGERLRTLAGASFRLDTWRDALRLAGQSPVVGSGLGAFHDAYPPCKRGYGLLRVEHAENEYLETLAETGLVGTALALAGFVVLAHGQRRAEAAGQDRVVRGVGRGALAALVALAAHSLVDFDLRVPASAALAALAASAVAGAAGCRPRPLGRRACLALAAASAALLVAVLSLPEQPWLAAREEARLASLASARPVRALRLLRAEGALVAVVARRPAHAESWLMLAGVRAAGGDSGGAAALARHAVGLDPTRPELAAAAASLDPVPRRR